MTSDVKKSMMSTMELSSFSKVRMFGLVPTMMTIPVENVEPAKDRVRSAISYYKRHKCLPATVTDGTGVFDVQGLCTTCNAVVMRKRIGEHPEPVPETVECSRCRKMRQTQPEAEPVIVQDPDAKADGSLDIDAGAAFWTPTANKVAGAGIRDVVPNMEDRSLLM